MGVGGILLVFVTVYLAYSISQKVFELTLLYLALIETEEQII